MTKQSTQKAAGLCACGHDRATHKSDDYDFAGHLGACLDNKCDCAGFTDMTTQKAAPSAGALRAAIAAINGVGWTLSEVQIAEIIDRETACSEMVEALTGVKQLLDDGILVRDISHDHEPGWAMKQIPLVRTLVLIEAALKKAGAL
jgi:hypothetical protein